MSLLGSDLCEVYGNSFVDNFNVTSKPSKNNKKKSRKYRHNEEKVKRDALLTNYDKELFEGFANFNSKPKPQVEVIKQESFQEENENENEEEEEEVVVEKKKPQKVKVNCEMDDMNDKINELDTKINLLLDKLNDSSESEKKTDETANIYDLILFVIFGIFFLLVLESISKLVIKNSMKYGGIQGIMNS